MRIQCGVIYGLKKYVLLRVFRLNFRLKTTESSHLTPMHHEDKPDYSGLSSLIRKNYSTFIERRWDFLTFGIVISSIPSLNFAFAFASSTSCGNGTVRIYEPFEISQR